MRKYFAFILFISVFFTNCATTTNSSSRTNEELAQIINVTTLRNITGWSKNSAGQWKSARSIIPSEYNFEKKTGTDNIINLKVHKIAYNNEFYYAIERTKNEKRYRYPHIEKGEYYINHTYFYILSESDFVLGIKKNDNYVNKFDNFFYNSTPTSNVNKKRLQFEFTRLIRNKLNMLNLIRKDAELKIFTYYDEPNELVRFYLTTEQYIKAMPENYYFEVRLNDFSNVFVLEVF